MKKDLQENIISAVNQNKHDTYFNGEGKLKVMFVGNSITKHEPKPEVGWTNDCGMAASSEDKDYVHLMVKKFEDYFGEEISWTIVQVANYERNFDPARIDGLYSSAKDYNPDIMIMFFGANVPKDYDTAENPPFKFADSYDEIRKYLKGENTLVFHSQGFYIRPVLDAEKETVAKKYNEPFINIEDIRNREDTHGMFNHPSDLGMQEIADRFWSVIEPKL